MTFQEEIAAVQLRIAKAKSDRDTWRISGMQDNYLEACSLVDALELQLERLRQEGLRAFARAPEPASVCALLASAASAIADAPSERARIMAELSTSGSEESGPKPPAEPVEAPDESQRAEMAALAITFQDGVYHLGTYRYDRLADAVSYARYQAANPEMMRP